MASQIDTKKEKELLLQLSAIYLQMADQKMSKEEGKKRIENIERVLGLRK